MRFFWKWCCFVNSTTRTHETHWRTLYSPDWFTGFFLKWSHWARYQNELNATKSVLMTRTLLLSYDKNIRGGLDVGTISIKFVRIFKYVLGFITVMPLLRGLTRNPPAYAHVQGTRLHPRRMIDYNTIAQLAEWYSLNYLFASFPGYRLNKVII